METRKQKEIAYYDEKAEFLAKEPKSRKGEGDFEGFNPLDLNSFRFLYGLLQNFCKGKKVLDYGCGNGVHSAFLVNTGAEKVIAIDLSEKSLEVAKEKVRKEGMEDKIDFLKMDCEKMDFPDDYFDIVFDGGTFSSLDLKKAFPELIRVLKPGGILIGIETFGHNPLTNLKRRLNKIKGRRTAWAAEHILKEDNLDCAKNYFGKIETSFFHLISWITFPFLSLPGGKSLLRIFEFCDKILFCLPFLRRYAFKIVFIFSEPKK